MANLKNLIRKEIIYLPNKNGDTIPVLKETVDMIKGIKKILRENIDILSQSKHATAIQIDQMTNDMLFGRRAKDLTIMFDERQVNVQFLYDTVAGQKAGKTSISEGYDYLAPDSMIVYVLDEFGISVTEAYLYSWITKELTDASGFASIAYGMTSTYHAARHIEYIY